MFRRSAESEGFVHDGHLQHWCKPNRLTPGGEWSPSTETFLGFHLGHPVKLAKTDDSRNYFVVPTLQDSKTKNKRKGHPCPWDIPVPARFLRRLSHLKDCTVLDCFCGNGATLVTANRLGMKAIGIDISETYLGNAAEAIRRG
jgi:DNA modification methylase